MGGVPHTRGTAGEHTRRTAGEKRTLTSVEAGGGFEAATDLGTTGFDTTGFDTTDLGATDLGTTDLGATGFGGAGERPDSGQGPSQGYGPLLGRTPAPGPRARTTETDAYGDERAQSKLWHITLSVSGAEAPIKEVRRGLEQLANDHPFLLTSRYANDHAEIRYWEEARDLHDAAAVALRLWGEHRSTAKLPPWEIVGLEVIDRQTYHLRIAEGYGPPPASPVGVHPF
ncbi:hypothetical protein FFZ77_12995 [Streptomyces katsurahamanus]|uniref:Pentapeptide repeat-containing protein n=1 Tax=Streptomyces katsurahamanus TaxID=2577098 RepID=A0ABW9NT53_9ACTN|nr:hypothetical protein [Streptomyces katsurahamanus]